MTEPDYISLAFRKASIMKRIAPWMIVTAGVLWGSMGIFVKRYDTFGLTSMDIVAIRAVTTTFLMLGFLLIYNRRLLKIRWKDWWCFFGTGILSILFFGFCYFTAIKMTSLSVAAVLLYTAPAMVMLLSRILFREKITLHKLVALAATFAGCIFVTGIAGGGQAMSFSGILVGLGAGFGYALYSIFSRYALERGYHTYTIIFYTFLVAAIGVLPFTNVVGVVNMMTAQVSMTLFSLVFGLVSTVLPYVLYTIGLKYVENGKASIIASVEPVVATILGIVLFGERLTINVGIGIALVLGAIVLCNKKDKNDKSRFEK